MLRALAPRPRRGRGCSPRLEGLEDRRLPAPATPDIAVVAATTLDSKGVTVAYDIKGAAVDAPITFGFYRSADGQPGPGDELIGAGTIAAADQPGGPTLDLAGQPAGAQGSHQVTFPLPGGLRPDPSHPYVVVQADPAGLVAESSKSDNVASFRVYVIGVLAHGEMQPQGASWKRNGPPWEQKMGAALRAEGYDAVIPYNWVAASVYPGAAAKQGPKLAQQILATAAQFPPDAPVDLHLISYSEGAVVTSQAVLWLNRHGLPPNVQSGFLRMTMLDPHSANNGAPGGKQYSVKHGFLGWLTDLGLQSYQAAADDPLVVVPPNVADAEVFYQHTPVGQTRNTNQGLVNLWGQVPVVGQAEYYDLTGRGLSHTGNYNLMEWYQTNVVPTLATGAPFVLPGLHTAQLVNPDAGASSPPDDRTSTTRRPTLTGTATPGSRIKIAASRAGSRAQHLIGHAVAGADGTWTLKAKPLADGTYRLIAVTAVPASPQNTHVRVRLRSSLGTITVAAQPGAATT
jgi:hypothetical protein